MKRNSLKIFLFVFLFFFLTYTAKLFAQNSEHLAEDSPVSLLYDGFLGENKLLFNGQVYGYNYTQAEGHQYLNSPAFERGSITYHGITYQDIELNFDIYNNIVFFPWRDGINNRLAMFNPGKISRFTINGRKFLNLTSKDFQGLESGFYEEVFKGQQYIFLIQNIKRFLTQARDPNTNKTHYFARKDRFFLIQDGLAIEISNKKDVLNSFREIPDLSAFLKKEKLKFSTRKGTFKSDMISVLEFVSQTK